MIKGLRKRYLLENSSNNENQDIFLEYERRGKTAIIKYIRNGGDVDYQDSFMNNNTLLHYAVLADDLNSVKTLIEARADMDIQNDNGDTPLHIAIRNTDQEISEFLIKKGADLEIANDDGDYPIHLAIHENRYKTLGLLIKKGADLESKDGFKDTALQSAIEDDATSHILTLLIKNGASKKHIDKKKLNYMLKHNLAYNFFDSLLEDF